MFILIVLYLHDRFDGGDSIAILLMDNSHRLFFLFFSINYSSDPRCLFGVPSGAGRHRLHAAAEAG